jgi:hypothetical protein
MLANVKNSRQPLCGLEKKTNYQGFGEETVLLKNIVDLESNKIVTEHLWFAYTKKLPANPSNRRYVH